MFGPTNIECAVFYWNHKTLRYEDIEDEDNEHKEFRDNLWRKHVEDRQILIDSFKERREKGIYLYDRSKVKPYGTQRGQQNENETIDNIMEIDDSEDDQDVMTDLLLSDVQTSNDHNHNQSVQKQTELDDENEAKNEGSVETMDLSIYDSSILPSNGSQSSFKSSTSPTCSPSADTPLLHSS